MVRAEQGGLRKPTKAISSVAASNPRTDREASPPSSADHQLSPEKSRSWLSSSAINAAASVVRMIAHTRAPNVVEPSPAVR